jgi:hypothetical protein
MKPAVEPNLADRPADLLLPLSFSLVLHAAVVWLFSAGAITIPLDRTEPLDIEILDAEEARRLTQSTGERPPEPAPEAPAPERPKTQIVAPPDSPEAIPEDPRFLSDRNSRAPQETVKRGEPAPAAEPPRELARRRESSPSSAEERPVAKRSEPRRDAPAPARDLPGLPSLFARPSEILDDPAIGKGTRQGSGKETRDYAAVSRPELWADPGERGTPDYLPEIRQGQFTLLNTKADLFAPFVRRVGLRVFQTFSMDFKRRIYSGTVPQGQETIEVEAIMSRDGQRLEVLLRKRDGNLATDRLLLGTLTDTIFFDENPPPKAVAEDGRIHFVFALDSAVWYGRDDSGLPRPGAQWVFGAGLL